MEEVSCGIPKLSSSDPHDDYVEILVDDLSPTLIGCHDEPSSPISLPLSSPSAGDKGRGIVVRPRPVGNRVRVVGGERSPSRRMGVS